MEPNLKLSIIIINYNGAHYLEACIASVYKYCKGIDHEIILLDNNSKDNSIQIIEELFPEIILIKSKQNLGFAKGNNKAIEYATGDFLLLLNNDTELLENLLPVLSFFKGSDHIGALTIKMLDGQNNYLPSVGKFPKPLRMIRLSFLNYSTNQILTGNFKDKEPIKVDWSSGAFLMTRRSDYIEVQGLDEDYFMYVEDVDYCKKLANINKSTLYLPNYHFKHHVGFNKQREHFLIKGYFLYASKHFNKFEQIIAKINLSVNYAFKKAFKNIH